MCPGICEHRKGWTSRNLRSWESVSRDKLEGGVRGTHVVLNCRGGRCGRVAEGMVAAMDARERCWIVLRKEFLSVDEGRAPFIKRLRRCIGLWKDL